jgi:hypothetical protein
MIRGSDRLIRLRAALTPVRRATAPSERAVLTETGGRVGFDLAVPSVLPRGWRITGHDLVPGARSLATLLLSGPRGGFLRLTERVPTVPLAEEVALLGHPHRTLRFRGHAYVVFDGAWAAGEPVDGWHWHRTRQVLAWERDGVICELEHVVGQGPGLAGTLRVAHATRRERRVPRAMRVAVLHVLTVAVGGVA